MIMKIIVGFFVFKIVIATIKEIYHKIDSRKFGGEAKGIPLDFYINKKIFRILKNGGCFK